MAYFELVYGDWLIHVMVNTGVLCLATLQVNK